MSGKRLSPSYSALLLIVCLVIVPWRYDFDLTRTDRPISVPGPWRIIVWPPTVPVDITFRGRSGELWSTRIDIPRWGIQVALALVILGFFGELPLLRRAQMPNSIVDPRDDPKLKRIMAELQRRLIDAQETGQTAEVARLTEAIAAAHAEAWARNIRQSFGSRPNP